MTTLQMYQNDMEAAGEPQKMVLEDKEHKEGLSLRRSSRPVKKKKFFHDENVEDIRKLTMEISPSSKASTSKNDVYHRLSSEVMNESFNSQNDIPPSISLVGESSEIGHHATAIKKSHPSMTTATKKIKKPLPKNNKNIPSTSVLESKSQFVTGNLGNHQSGAGGYYSNPNIPYDQLGRWKPIDDLKLIINTVQTNDLRKVKDCVKFTCHFNLKEIQERWYRLLYDPIISKMAKKSIKLHLAPELVTNCYAKALFSDEEESILSKIISNHQHTLKQFEDLLQDYPSIFLPTRTAKELQEHWSMMKYHVLLPDQIVKGSHASAQQPSKISGNEGGVVNSDLPSTGPEGLSINALQTATNCSLDFSDMEALMAANPSQILQHLRPLQATPVNSNAITSKVDHQMGVNPMASDTNSSSLNLGPSHRTQSSVSLSRLSSALRSTVFERELETAENHRLQEIDGLEKEIPMWQALVDKEMGITSEFDDSTFAALQGKVVRFLIKSREVSFGRYCNNYGSNKPIDVDLSLEGPSKKISRLQGYIKLKGSTGEFFITNEGRKPFFVDGRPILPGDAVKLRDKSVVEFSFLHFIFVINHTIVNQLKLHHETNMRLSNGTNKNMGLANTPSYH